MKRGLRIDCKDSVGVVLEDVSKGESIDFGDNIVVARADLMMPHKVALQDIDVNQEIFKYGEVIGYATQRIRKGDHVHVHNLDSEKLMK